MAIKIIQAYKELIDHYEPITKVILERLESISNPKDKIKYLQSEDIKYLIDVGMNPNLMHASGVVTYQNPHKAGLDRWIELQIQKMTHDDIGHTSINKIRSKKTSYKWQGNPDELPKLYKLMIDKYKLIGPDTTPEQFKAVFTGQPIDKIDKIERTKKFTNVLLTYFVSELFQKSNPNDYLSIAESCFDGAKNLSQAQTNYINNQNRLPKSHSLIDDLLIDLKNPL
jgi:hypothetical protein